MRAFPLTATMLFGLLHFSLPKEVVAQQDSEQSILHSAWRDDVMPLFSDSTDVTSYSTDYSTEGASTPERLAGKATVSDEVCDSDWDGAAIGAAIGVSPMILSILISDDVEGSTGWLLLGAVGGIAGFWAGLAIDSASC